MKKGFKSLSSSSDQVRMAFIIEFVANNLFIPQNVTTEFQSLCDQAAQTNQLTQQLFISQCSFMLYVESDFLFTALAHYEVGIFTFMAELGFETAYISTFDRVIDHAQTGEPSTYFSAFLTFMQQHLHKMLNTQGELSDADFARCITVDKQAYGNYTERESQHNTLQLKPDSSGYTHKYLPSNKKLRQFIKRLLNNKDEGNQEIIFIHCKVAIAMDKLRQQWLVQADSSSSTAEKSVAIVDDVFKHYQDHFKRCRAKHVATKLINHTTE